jgi:hypothetical protein
MKKNIVLKYSLPLFLALLSGCTTYSVTVVHSEGMASDLVDETQSQTPTANVSPTVSIPASLIPGG